MSAHRKHSIVLTRVGGIVFFETDLIDPETFRRGFSIMLAYFSSLDLADDEELVVTDWEVFPYAS